MKKPLRILRSSRGFTLIELLVSMSILTVVVGIFGTGMFQVLSIQRFWTDDIVAVREVRHAGSWFAGDALNATEVLDAGGVTRLTCTPSPVVQQVTLTWTDTTLSTALPETNCAGILTATELPWSWPARWWPVRSVSRYAGTLCG